jgi:hypothetical protein
MRLTLIIGESEAKALTRLAVREDRAPRHQAERLLREALVAAGDLAPDARPCDRPLGTDNPGDAPCATIGATG